MIRGGVLRSGLEAEEYGQARLKEYVPLPKSNNLRRAAGGFDYPGNLGIKSKMYVKKHLLYKYFNHYEYKLTPLGERSNFRTD